MFYSLIRDWFRAPFANFRLFHNFTRQDFYIQFAGSIGGFFWLFITPLIHIIIYSFVFSYIFQMRAVEGYGETAFVIFLMVGYLPWFAFADSVGRSTGLLLEKAPLITKVMFPVQVLPFVGTSVPYITHGIGIIVLLVYLATQGYANWLWPLLPLVFFLQYLFTIGLVAILSALSVFLRDLQQIVALGIMVWFFLTPIIYPVSLIQNPTVQTLFLLNPMHSFINLYREIVLTGEVSMIHFAIAIPVSVLTFLFGGWLFMRIKHAFGDVL